MKCLKRLFGKKKKEPVYHVYAVGELPPVSNFEKEVLEDINFHRALSKLKPLFQTELLRSVSYTHCIEMLTVGKASHDFFFARKAYIDNKLGGDNKMAENVAYGYTSGGSTVLAWMRSQGHKEAMLGDYNYVGVSTVFNNDDKSYTTVTFLKI